MIFRFMSQNEFDKYLSGEILINNKNHAKDSNARTTSVGFCFFDEKEVKIEDAIDFMAGIINMEVLAVFEPLKKLNVSSGCYADNSKIKNMNVNEMLDEIEYMLMENKPMHGFKTIKELCTTSYSRNDMKLIKYCKNSFEKFWDDEKLIWEEL